MGDNQLYGNVRLNPSGRTRSRARELGFSSVEMPRSLSANDTGVGAVSFSLTGTSRHHGRIRQAGVGVMRLDRLYWNRHGLPTDGFTSYLQHLENDGSPVPDDLLDAIADALQVRIVRIGSEEGGYVTEFKPRGPTCIQIAFILSMPSHTEALVPLNKTNKDAEALQMGAVGAGIEDLCRFERQYQENTMVPIWNYTAWDDMLNLIAYREYVPRI